MAIFSWIWRVMWERLVRTKEQRPWPLLLLAIATPCRRISAMSRSPMWKLLVSIGLALTASAGYVSALGPVTWGDFGAALPQHGVPTTVSLGGR